MSNFINDDLNQTVFFDINYQEVLGKDTFEYCLYYLLENRLDLSVFINKYNNRFAGRKAYHPALMLRVIFYAYYRGITSSRAIERLCKTDLKFIALAAGKAPHFTTIADFVSCHCKEMGDLFHKVLLVCDESGLIGKEHFAIDGCKLPSDASRQWSGKHHELKKKSEKMRAAANKIIERHQANDRKTDNKTEAAEKQTVETLIRNADKIDRFLEANDPRMGARGEINSNITDNESASMMTGNGAIQGFACVTAADEKRQVIVGAEAFGMGQEQATLQPMIEGIKANLSEDVLRCSLKLTADTGFSSEANMRYVFKEGINAYIPDAQFRKRNPLFAESETYQQEKEKRKKTRRDKKLVEAKISNTEFVFNESLKTCICPAGKQMMYLGERDTKTTEVRHRFRGYLKTCRACPLQSQCMKNPAKDRGRQVSFLVKAKKKEKYLDLMKRKIDSEEGRRIYSRRMWTIEPVFGNITSNKGLKRLSHRGKAKVTGQWLMYCMVHNIEKLWRYGNITGNMG